VRELRVLLRFWEQDVRPVGTLAEERRRVWFEYDAGFAGGRPGHARRNLPVLVDGVAALYARDDKHLAAMGAHW
jgi:hypothetical protein